MHTSISTRLFRLSEDQSLPKKLIRDIHDAALGFLGGSVGVDGIVFFAQVNAQTHDGDAPPSVSAMPPSRPDLKTTVEFFGQMVEPEHRDVLQGELRRAELHSSNGASITMVSNESMRMVFTTGTTQKNGYSEFTCSHMLSVFRRRRQTRTKGLSKVHVIFSRKYRSIFDPI
jgi:hypothetical protein